MASKLIKLAALERLSEIIERAVPDLRGRVHASALTRDQREKLPNLGITTETFRYVSQQPDEHDYLRLDADDEPGKVREPVPGSPIFCVGAWVGTVRLELGADNPPARYRLEHLVEQVFLGSTSGHSAAIGDPGRAGRPGTLLVDLPNVPNLYGARCSFTMDDASWQNEKAFTNEWFSWLRLDVEIPALVAYQDVPTMRELRLIATVAPATPIAVLADRDADVTALIGVDGSITEQ